VFIYQLGDHDPSGVDAWRAFTDKVFGFVAERYGDAESWLHFERLAVTAAQITTMNLPTRPTKQTDSRAAKFDGESVEVDAIPAPVLRQLIEDAITQYIDPDALRVTRFAEQSERDLLIRMRQRTGGAARPRSPTASASWPSSILRAARSAAPQRCSTWRSRPPRPRTLRAVPSAPFGDEMARAAAVPLLSQLEQGASGPPCGRAG
jgi:hypothetical protein